MPLLSLAFRPFFLLASGFSVLGMLLWGGWLTGSFSISPFGGMRFWHIHEMTFGFVGAVIVGFLLTAVQTWTGNRSINGSALLFLAAIWLLARLLPFMPIDNLYIGLLAANIGYFLFSALVMGLLVIKANNKRNFFFVPVLCLFALLSSFTIIGFRFVNIDLYQSAYRAGLFLIVTLMTIISGRVFPMFTANGTQTKKVVPQIWLERSVIGLAISMLGLAGLGLLNHSESFAVATIFAVAALLNGWRAFRWYKPEIFRFPLVWSLHLSYWFIPIGFLLLSLYFMGFGVMLSAGIHSLTAGAMGCMILAMMGRVSLGHTGRPLHPPKSFLFAMLLAGIGATLRIIYGISGFQSLSLLIISIICWSSAFMLFLLSYSKMLLKPRVDNQLLEAK